MSCKWHFTHFYLSADVHLSHSHFVNISFHVLIFLTSYDIMQNKYANDEVDVLLFTLNDFISNCGFSNLNLLTCPDKINSQITGVNVIDNPDVTQWVKPGEVVLTTGYFFANDPRLQTNVVMNLKTVGCSALCIKLKRFFPELPKTLLETASHAGLPIIDLPPEYSFSELTQVIHERINDQKFREIQREQLFFHALLNAFRSERSLTQCLQLLSDYLSKSLFIVDRQLQCLSFSLQVEDRKRFSQTDNIVITSITDKYPLLNAEKETYLLLSINSCDVYAALIPFPDDDLFLCMNSETFLASSELIMRAMKLFRFPQERLAKSPSGFSAYYSDFFHLLLSDDAKQVDIDKVCNYYGYPHTKQQVCILFSLREADSAVPPIQPVIDYLKDCLHAHEFTSSMFFLAAYQRQVCLFLFSDPALIQKEMFLCVEQFQERYHSVFSVGISQFIAGDREIISSYHQASFLMSLAGIFPDKTYYFFDDYLLFWHIRNLSEEQRERLFSDTIKPLVNYDEKNNSELFQTLLQYFHSQFNASLASKELFIHRNTFLKRLSKIEELIRFHPDDINNMFSLYYGICIYLMKQL